jgi:hypothetical protein
MDLELAARLLLQRRDGGEDIGGDDARARPGRLARRRGDDVLRPPVEHLRDAVGRVGHLRPEARRHLVGGAAERDLVGPVEPAVDDPAEALIDVRDDSAAAGEAVGGVLLGAAGTLQDAVEAEERVPCELHVRETTRTDPTHRVTNS